MLSALEENLNFNYDNYVTMTLRLFQIAFFITAASRLDAQSSDNIKYYILYDISGSVAQIDTQNHLSKLLAKTIKEVNGKIDHSPSFEIIFFGQDKEIKETFSFDLSELRNEADYVARVNLILKAIKNNQSKTKFNRFTHLDAALKKVNSDAGGIFILSDGQILPGDVDLQSSGLDINQYVWSVRDMIDSFEAKKIPVFFIQSNCLPGSPFWEGDVPALQNDSVLFAKSERYFWISNVTPDPGQAFSSFDQFMAMAHQQILSANAPIAIPNRMMPVKDDVVETMVDVNALSESKEQLLEYKAELATINPKDPKIELIESILRIPLILSDKCIPVDSVVVLRKLIVNLSSRNDQLKEILNRLQERQAVIKEYKSFYLEARMGSRVEPIEIEFSGKSSVSEDLEKIVIQGLADYVIKRTKDEAIYFLFEDMSQKGLLSNTFVRDTLFYYTFTFLKDLKMQPDLLLIKEAFNRDIDELHTNLIKSKRIGEAESLVALTYAYELVRNIGRYGQLEEAFVRLDDFTKSGRLTGLARHVERGVRITTFLIAELARRDLVSPYTEPGSDYFDELSKMLVTYFSVDKPDFATVCLGGMNEKVKALYFEYKAIKDRVEELKTLMASQPSSGTTEYRQYRRDLLLEILHRSTDLIIAGVDFSSHFLRRGENNIELIKQVESAKRNAIVAIESWYLIRDKEYVKAMMLLLPSILDVIDSSPKLTKFEDVQLRLLLESVGKENENFNNLKNQLIRWKLESMRQLRKKLDTDQLLIDSLNRFNSAKITELNDYADKLAKIGYEEFTSLVERRSEVYFVDVKHVNQIKTFLCTVLSKENRWNNVKLKKLNRPKFKLSSYQFPSKFALDFVEFPNIGENFRKMVLIGGEVSSAKEASDITNILTKYALPTASYRLKREQKFSIFVNSYSGIGGSYFVKSDTISPVISAPLGIEFSWRLRIKKHMMSTSILLAPIDVGNVINYQILGSQPKNGEDPFKFENIYSPSAFLVLGLSKRHPFSVGAGYQWNDNRLGAFIGFDLPIFRLK